MMRLPPATGQVVLISGCSSGIGWAVARRLCRDGHWVWATARRAESVAELAALPEAQTGHLCARILDVTDADTIARVVDEIHTAHGAVDVLINNAGYGQIGAVEEIPMELWRKQTETNFIGAVALTRACLPAMRARRRGRVINVSSVVAHAALPLMGAYCASKHALDAFSVALRLEVAHLGIDVVLIEPGPIATEFRASMERNLDAQGISRHPAYADLHRALNAYRQSRFGRQGATSEDVATRVSRAVRARRPRRRYRITLVARWAPRVLSLVPEAVFDAAVLRRMKRTMAPGTGERD